MAKATDIRLVASRLYFLPVATRVPLKFGPETTTSVTCARACVAVTDAQGRRSEGWGETPLSVQWVWPSRLSYEWRHDALKQFCVRLAEAWAKFDCQGHPLEIGHDFQANMLPLLLARFNQQNKNLGESMPGLAPTGRRGHETEMSEPGPATNLPPPQVGGDEPEPMPWLAALVCCSVFDIAVHDAYGQLHQRPVYETYNAECLNRDLGYFLKGAEGSGLSFKNKYPANFLVSHRPDRLRAWHLVGGLDVLETSELTGAEPKDGYPVLLSDWIERDGLKCLKVKLCGNDAAWDYERLVKVGTIAARREVEWLSADFNCTVAEPSYVNTMLDRLRAEFPRLYGMILYVEQPFPYELEQHRIDVRSVSARKPLFLDESAHDWRLVKLGRQLGWTGVALKTCKTQTGALLTACWAKAHGMMLMVQDLTNPMLAQIPHVLLAAHVGTIMGVETNAMQFYPDASSCEEKTHPGLYRRRDGQIDLRTVRGPGFGYRLTEIRRTLPEPVIQFEVR